MSSDSKSGIALPPSLPPPTSTSTSMTNSAPPNRADTEIHPDVNSAQHPSPNAETNKRGQLLAFLLSLIVHTSLLILLALIAWQPKFGVEVESDVIAEIVAIRNEPTKVEMLSSGDTPPPPSPQFDNLSPTQQSAQIQQLSRLLDMEALAEAENQSESIVSRLSNVAELTMNLGFASTGVEGRQLDKRQEIALSRGGSLEE